MKKFILPLLALAGAFIIAFNHAPYVTIDDFGANGDDTLPDDLAIQQALASGATDVRGTSGKHYYFAQQIVIPTGVTFDGQGAELEIKPYFPNVNSFRYIVAGPSSNFHSSESITVTKGSFTFRTPNASKLNVGQLVEVQLGTGDIWMSKVVSTSGDTVRVSHAAQGNFIGNELTQYDVCENVHVKNWTLNFLNRTTGNGLSLVRNFNSSVEYVNINGNPARKDTSLRQALYVSGIGNVVDHCDFNGGANRNSSEAQYGCNAVGHDITVKNSTGRSFKHVLASAGSWSNNIVFDNNTVDNGVGPLQVIDMHERTWGTVKNNTVTGNQVASCLMRLRSSNILVTGNTLLYINDGTGGGGQGIVLSQDNVDNIVVRDNRITIVSPNSYLKAGVSTPTTVRAITVNANDDGVAMNGLVIERNHVTHRIVIDAKLGTGCRVSDNIFTTNNTATYPSLEFNSPAFGTGFECNGNVFYNQFGNSSSQYAIDLGPGTKAGGTFQNNVVYKSNCANVQTGQFVGFTGFTASGNNVYTCSTPFPTLPTVPATPVPAPAVPAAPTFAATATGVVLTWPAAQWAETYLVYRSNTSGGLFVQISSSLTTQTFTDNAVTPGNTYYYKLRAVNSYDESSLSAFVGATVPFATLPGKPDVPALVVKTTKSVMIALKPVANATSYRVVMSTSGGGYATIGNLLPPGNFTVNNLAEATAYAFKVYAVNTNGDSPSSDPLSVTTDQSAQAYRTKNKYQITN